MVLRGSGFCPGHITGFFSYYDTAKDPWKRGSRGAGVNLDTGVIVICALVPPEDDVEKGDLSLELNVSGMGDKEPNSELYSRVLMDLLPDEGRGWAVSLRVRIQLPAGRGFGMSAAGALATAVSLWDAFHSHLPKWDRKRLYVGE